MAQYVLLDQNNKVLGTAVWDGVTPYDPPGVTTIHLLPTPPPVYNVGDTYDPASDTVTPAPPGADEAVKVTVRQIVVQTQNAITQLQTVRNQAQALQTKPDYTTANLAGLNDLLHTVQQVGLGVDECAQDLIGVAKMLLRKFD